MKRFITLLLAALCLTLSGCGQEQVETARLTIVTTTYPVYLLACSVTEGVEGVRVERLNTGEASCLHDYTLSMNDMRLLEEADAVALSGAGLEEFMEDALATSEAFVIDCSTGVELLENLSHHHEEAEAGDGHDHGHWDPHYWLDLENVRIMAGNLSAEVQKLDPEHAGEYAANAAETDETLLRCKKEAEALLEQYLPERVPGLITFHDGFQYFAKAFDLPLLESIEEEAGSEASAKEIVEITELVKEKNLPVIFTEVNGSAATANAIARETGCRVVPLSMLMDGVEADDPEFGGAEEYSRLCENLCGIINGFLGEGTVAYG